MVIVPPHGGVADIGLSSYSPVRRRAATRAIHLGPRGYLNCSPQSQADLVTPIDDRFVHAVCAGHQWKVHLGIVDQAVVPPGLEHTAQIAVSDVCA